MVTRILTTLRGLLQRPRVGRELDEELAFHVEMEVEANTARGMSPADARRAALRDFGGVVQTQEAVRDVRVLSIESVLQDIQHAVRVLAARPGFAMAVVGMLALAVGLTTAMFTVVDALILRPVPFKDPDQLASVYMGTERGGNTTVAPAVLHAWRDSPAFAGAESATARLVPRVQPLAGLILDAYYARAVPLLAGGVILVFLVLCANVCSLLLARLTDRRREFSMRAALGASRGRLMRQALVESGVVGALGIVVGVGIAWVLVSLARAFLPEAFLLRTLNPLNIDARAGDRVIGRRGRHPRRRPAAGVDGDARRRWRVAPRRRSRSDGVTCPARRHARAADHGDRSRLHAAGRRDAADALVRQPGHHGSRIEHRRRDHRVAVAAARRLSSSGSSPPCTRSRGRSARPRVAA